MSIGTFRRWEHASGSSCERQKRARRTWRFCGLCVAGSLAVAARLLITTTPPPRPRSSSKPRPHAQPDLGRVDRLDSALLPPSTSRSYRRPRCFRAAFEDLLDLSATSIARSTRSSFTHARTAPLGARSMGTDCCVAMRRHRARWSVEEGACSARIATDARVAGAR